MQVRGFTLPRHDLGCGMSDDPLSILAVRALQKVADELGVDRRDIARLEAENARLRRMVDAEFDRGFNDTPEEPQ